ncbi:hypothetical protein [Nocardia cyriacigeorgica]|uniref:hypothetical protein n=1 Tax=Nocardia cyriacigeorgica TaxID=135487 RepID=UPI0034DB5448
MLEPQHPSGVEFFGVGGQRAVLAEESDDVEVDESVISLAGGVLDAGQAIDVAAQPLREGQLASGLDAEASAQDCLGALGADAVEQRGPSDSLELVVEYL